MIKINPKIEEFLSQIAAENDIPLSDYTNHVLKVGLDTIYKNNIYKNTVRDSDFYESYDEFIKDYEKYMQDEDKKAKEIIEQNKKDIEYLRKKYAE